jgi:hypothetical protein
VGVQDVLHMVSASASDQVNADGLASDQVLQMVSASASDQVLQMVLHLIKSC